MSALPFDNRHEATAAARPLGANNRLSFDLTDGIVLIARLNGQPTVRVHRDYLCGIVWSGSTGSVAMDQNIRFCTTADGLRLAYAMSGDGPPLVLSATWLTHLEHQWRSLAWRPWLDVFAREM